jgi:hypothetical protein
MNQKKYTPGTSPLGQAKEEEHWETLRSLLTQMPAPAQQPSSPIAFEPLLKRTPDKSSIVIGRSTAEHFPLPSAVPVAEQSAAPVKKQPAEPMVRENAAPAKTAPITAQPESDARRQSTMHKRLTDSWTRKISQRVANTFDDGRATRGSSSSIRTITSGQSIRNQAEVAYNQQGQVDYVTYTFNAPSQKKRRR